MYTFAKSSINHLKQVHPDLRRIMLEAKNRAEIDFDISCGYRSPEEQLNLYKLGRSQLDGYKHKSKHNYEPYSWAVDIYAYKGKYADYDLKKMKYLTDIFKNVADEYGIKIECGINWPEFVDSPHVELI
jgi:peptidoglycan L-alanyl-D-glutamate endopeptidase CwlK